MRDLRSVQVSFIFIKRPAPVLEICTSIKCSGHRQDASRHFHLAEPLLGPDKASNPYQRSLPEDEKQSGDEKQESALSLQNGRIVADRPLPEFISSLDTASAGTHLDCASSLLIHVSYHVISVVHV